MRWLALLLVVFSLTVRAGDLQRVAFDLDAVPVSQVLRVVFGEVVKTPYVLDPVVVADARPISFRWDSSQGDVRPFLRATLDMLGYELGMVGGVDLVRPKREQLNSEEREAFVYRPRHRDGSYLVDLLAPLFKGAFTARKAVSAPAGSKLEPGNYPPGSAAALIDRGADVLVFHGSADEVRRLSGLLEQVDVPTGEALVRGVLYEVQTGNKQGSAFQLAASLLSAATSFEVGLGGGVSTLGDFLRLRSSGSKISIDAVLSALSSDSRFRVVSSPSLRVRSGASAKLVVGQDVPVLGALSYPQGSGQAVQSVEYRSSGVIFDLQPEIRAGVIDLRIGQQMSTFVRTETGVNSSPTLIKREFSTSVSLADGEIVVLGGLDENKTSGAETGFSFLPDFMRSQQADDSRSEILLVLQVSRLDALIPHMSTTGAPAARQGEDAPVVDIPWKPLAPGA